MAKKDKTETNNVKRQVNKPPSAKKTDLMQVTDSDELPGSERNLIEATETNKKAP